MSQCGATTELDNTDSTKLTIIHDDVVSSGTVKGRGDGGGNDTKMFVYFTGNVPGISRRLICANPFQFHNPDGMIEGHIQVIVDDARVGRWRQRPVQ